MAVMGVSATTMFDRHRRGINADWTSHTLPPEGKPDKFKPAMNILAISVINEVNGITDAAIVRAFVSEFTDAAGVHKGPFIGVASKTCTRIVWGLQGKNCVANAIRLIFFF
jgi:hypothetical protein